MGVTSTITDAKKAEADAQRKYELDFLQKIPGVEPFLIENAKKRIVNPK